MKQCAYCQKKTKEGSFVTFYLKSYEIKSQLN